MSLGLTDTEHETANVRPPRGVFDEMVRFR